jgi:zinc transport system substrate-binding protein
MRTLYLFLAICMASFSLPPKVVVSIKPIHSIVCGLMKGVHDPILLMAGNESPHHHALTAKEMTLLKSADVVVWVGEPYETQLKKPISNLTGKTIVTLVGPPGIKVLPPRSGGLWVTHHHHNHHHHHSHEQEHSHESLSSDGHIWLDPNNTKAIAQEIAQTLAERDPQHATRYMANCEEVVKKLEELDQDIQQRLQQMSKSSYIVLHDSTQYFDAHFGTNAIGSLIEEPGHEPRPRHVREVTKAFETKKAVALFTEPMVSSPWIKRLSENGAVSLGTLDYIGIDLPAGEEAYFLMMRKMVDEMVRVMG